MIHGSRLGGVHCRVYDIILGWSPYRLILQVVVMLRNDGDGWLHGKSGEEEGLFPENYVEKLCTV